MFVLAEGLSEDTEDVRITVDTNQVVLQRSYFLPVSGLPLISKPLCTFLT